MSEGMNDTEGIRCLQKAEASLQSGDLSTAERLGRKALRMLSEDSRHSRQAAQKIINRATGKETRSDSNPNSSFPRNENSTSHRRTTPHQAKPSDNHPIPETHSAKHSSSETASDFNPEIEIKCQEILKAKNYYKILNVKQTGSPEDIKKAYRKLALQFHPDKAKCPSAEAAFKELAKAYQCLSNEETKKRYDTYGAEEDIPLQYHQQYESHFMSPEDLFESFFGVRVVRGPHSQSNIFRVGRGAARHQNHDAASADSQRRFYGLLQVLPLLVIIVISMFSNLFNSPSPAPYAFLRTSEYYIPRTTQEHKLPYYVKYNFQRTYSEQSDRLKELETNIEINHFSSECTREQQRLLQQLQNLRFYGTHEQYRRKAEEIRIKEESSVNCRKFKELKAKYPYSQRQQQGYRQSSGWL